MRYVCEHSLLDILMYVYNPVFTRRFTCILFSFFFLLYTLLRHMEEKTPPSLSVSRVGGGDSWDTKLPNSPTLCCQTSQPFIPTWQGDDPLCYVHTNRHSIRGKKYISINSEIPVTHRVFLSSQLWFKRFGGVICVLM